MKKLALLNGFVQDLNSKENLLISQGTIQGIGYIPDDEDSTKIELENHIILNDTISIGPLLKWRKKNNFLAYINTHGLNHALVLINENEIDNIGTYCIPILNCINKNLNQINFEKLIHKGLKGLYGVQFDNPNIDECLKIAKAYNIPLLIDNQGSELLYILQQNQKINSQLAIVLNDTELSLNLIENYLTEKIFISIPASLLKNKEEKIKVLNLFKKNTIHHIYNNCGKEPFITFVINNLIKDFSLNEILNQFNNVHKLFNEKKNISLTQEAKLTIIEKKSDRYKLKYMICNKQLWRHNNNLKVSIP